MFILLTLLVGLVIGILLGIALERWRPQVQRTVDALNDYRIGAELCDAGNLVIGAFLILSPWVFEFDTGVQSLNAVSSGIVIMSLSIAAFVGFAAWEEWGNLIVGLWLVVSPWILNSTEQPDGIKSQSESPLPRSRKTNSGSGPQRSGRA